MDILFFAALILYFAAAVIQLCGIALGKNAWCRIARWTLLGAFVLHTAFTVWRGVIAQRIPLANQFEFASGFAWSAALLGLLLHRRLRQEWVLAASMPVAFLVLSYAAFQPMEIKELMPALRSTWFALHIGSATFSYAAFAISGGLGVYYLMQLKKGRAETDVRLLQTDHMIYRLICLGFLLLTVVILSGAIWAEQAWSRWWSWDPKETWALITWILYAIFLHQRIRKKWQGKRMAWFAIIAVICVLFTFAGVNKLLPGLHSYAV